MGLGSEIRDPGSGKNLYRIPDPGVKKAQDRNSSVGETRLLVEVAGLLQENRDTLIQITPGELAAFSHFQFNKQINVARIR
jgi:hypothetical protein